MDNYLRIPQQYREDLDPDHPNSDLWPEAFCNGREEFSDHFYELFPWAKAVDPFDEEADDTSTEKVFECGLRRCLEPDRRIEVPPVIAFVKGLISLELDDLPEDEQHCPICMEKYRGETGEMPLELPCGHVIGRDCLLTWLSSFSGMHDQFQHDNCPQ